MSKKPTEELLNDLLVPEEEQPFEIPKSWVWVRIGDVIKINPKKPKLDFPDEQICSFLPMTMVNPKTGRIDCLEEREFVKVKKGYTYFEENDVLFAKITPCMENGNTVIAKGLKNEFGFGSTEFYVFRTPKQVDERYIYYLLRSEKFRKEAKREMTGAVGQQRVPKKFLENYPLPLPPLTEQKLITNKIEGLLTKIEQAKLLIEEAKETFELRRAAILDKAIRGEVSGNWREENTFPTAEQLLEEIVHERISKYNVKVNEAKLAGQKKPRKVLEDRIPRIDKNTLSLKKIPPKWTVTTLGFLAHVTKLAGFEYTKYFDLKETGDIPVVRAQNVKMGGFVESNLMYISKETSDFLERSQLHGREILMVFIGAGTGDVCMAPNNGRWHLAPNVAKIDVDGVFPEYICYYLQSPIGKSFINSKMKATAQQSLSMETIREIPVYLPPLDEQREIVKILRNLLSKLEEEKKGLDSISLKDLESAILSKAFRGELGTNDPNDESPIELLKELLSEKAGR